MYTFAITYLEVIGSTHAGVVQFCQCFHLFLIIRVQAKDYVVNVSHQGGLQTSAGIIKKVYGMIHFLVFVYQLLFKKLSCCFIILANSCLVGVCHAVFHGSTESLPVAIPQRPSGKETTRALLANLNPRACGSVKARSSSLNSPSQTPPPQQELDPNTAHLW
jgi:hypothetical protein